ncbi:Uncharacterised protein [Escherichia coli]|nr:Uncharacterised protein [Escherichia coli]
MFYPAVDYLVIILLLAFLMVTLFACIFLSQTRIYKKKNQKNEKRTFSRKRIEYH